MIPKSLIIWAKARHKASLKCTSPLNGRICRLLWLFLQSTLRFMNFFLLILAYARKKVWRKFQSKFVLLLFIKLFLIIITYTENMMNSLMFIYYYKLLLFIGYLLCSRDQSNNSRKSIHITCSYGVYSLIRKTS